MKINKLASLLLYPFGAVFGIATAIRRFLYGKNIFKSSEVDVATINIGNLAVGGTGKTPHCQYVISLLKDQFAVAALSRGYGRKSSGFHDSSSEPDVSSEVLGDEPFMTHEHFPDIPVAVDKNRVAGIAKLLAAHHELDVVVLDDAFQHLKLKASYNIILTDFQNPFCNDFPLPAGRLREFPSAAKFADTVIVTKTPPDENIYETFWRKKLNLKSGQKLFFTKIVYKKPFPATSVASALNFNEIKSAVLLTGIANPDSLYNHLSENFKILKHYNFSDHHDFSAEEFVKIRDKYFKNDENAIALFTTEKDFARMQSQEVRNIVSLLPVFVVPIEIDFLSEEQKNIFNQTILDHVRRKKEENRANC